MIVPPSHTCAIRQRLLLTQPPSALSRSRSISCSSRNLRPPSWSRIVCPPFEMPTRSLWSIKVSSWRHIRDVALIIFRRGCRDRHSRRTLKEGRALLPALVEADRHEERWKLLVSGEVGEHERFRLCITLFVGQLCSQFLAYSCILPALPSAQYFLNPMRVWWGLH